jgi:hypothetical protein
MEVHPGVYVSSTTKDAWQPDPEIGGAHEQIHRRFVTDGDDLVHPCGYLDGRSGLASSLSASRVVNELRCRLTVCRLTNRSGRQRMTRISQSVPTTCTWS